MTTLPEELAQSLTWDRGKEICAHAKFKVKTRIPVFFAEPQSRWQLGTKENTNGLPRQYFPRVQTSRDGPAETLRPSPTLSTPSRHREHTLEQGRGSCSVPKGRSQDR